jgi:hypothetical protein
MKDYKIIEHDNKITLERDVKEHLRNGWKPLGGIMVYWRNIHDYNVFHAQAMIKE